VDESVVRDRATRVEDAQSKLADEVDLWVSSASDDGRGYLVPLSYYWDGRVLTMAAHPRSPTVRYLERAGWARVALGPTRDVLVIEGPIGIFPTEGHAELAARHADATGFDTREDGVIYSFIRLTPDTIQAWRNAVELRGRYVMRDGEWLE
jgi:hypothetical protein